MTLNEISYFVAGRLNQPLNVVLVNEIKFAVNYWRSFILKQEIFKHGQSGGYTQTITVPLVLVDKGDNCYVDVGCKIQKTKLPISKPLNIKGDMPFNYVGPINMKRPFGYRNQSQIAFSFTGEKNQVFYSISNDYIYVWGDNKIDYITISGVFDEPNKAAELCISNANCLGDDVEYPCPGDIVKMITDGLLNGTFALKPLVNEILTRDGQEA